MPSIVIPPIGNPENSSFVTDLNSAIQELALAFDNVVWKDGSENLTGNLDVNSKRLFNLPAPVGPTEPVRFGDVAEFQGAPGENGADAPLPNWTFNEFTGAPGTDVVINVTGTYPNQVWDITIPRGSPGASGALGDGNYGDITVSGTGAVLTVNNNSITFAKLADLAGAGVIGGTGAGDPSLLSFATLKTNLALVKGDVGLGNVDNTSDANKPVSTAQQTALDLKLNISDAAGKFVTPVTLSTAGNTTLDDATHHNKLLKCTGGTTRDIILNSTPTAGFIAIIVNRGTVSWNLTCAGGIFKNGAASATSGVLAVNADITVKHEGGGVWSASGVGLT